VSACHPLAASYARDRVIGSLAVDQREHGSTLGAAGAGTERGPHQLYHSYTVEEDRERTNVHYERPAEFFDTITGGRWNVYSCNLWGDGILDDTAAQEAKLDLIAGLAGFKEGMRLLDVGCGWGGPLTYLCTHYGMEGVGLTLSPTQKTAAEERIRREQGRVAICLEHWQEYRAQDPYDVVFTDEVIVHFNDLGGFFHRCHDLLVPGGVMINKELHLKHPRLAKLERGGELVSEIYGDTGNYRTLSEELALANAAGFDVERVHHIEPVHYERTIDHWLENMFAGRQRLIELVGAADYKAFRTYLRLAQAIVQRNMTLDVVVCRRA
jgi:cyclopropane-fatty-acyl-phospholipid synthase